MNVRRIVLIALVAFSAAVIGAYAGRTFLPLESHTGAELHSLLHDNMELDARQEQRLAVLEREFSAQRQVLEARLRADNARLAEAIAAEHV